MKKKLFAVLLALAMVLSLLPVTALAADFADTAGHWGEAAIDRWAEYGVLQGDGGSFDPNGQMTRAQFAQMLCNLMGYTEKAANAFTDVPGDAWYADAILKLVAAGVMSGMGDGTAAPNAPITREQAAVLLCKAMNIKPSATASTAGFADSASVSGWARDAVAALTERGMISGVGDGLFAPGNNIQRAAVAQMVSNMVSDYVTESGTTITGNVEGIVIIKADNVKIENATLSEPLIVAPAAAGATVSLTGATSAADVVVEASGAKVVVAETASAKTVEVAAPSAAADIAGKVNSVTVDSKATNAAVTVEKTGTVSDVNVQAKGTDIEVSGKVANVGVASGADADIKAQAGAKVDNVTAAGDTTVSGPAGTVGNVTATGSADVDVKAPGAKVENNGSGDVTANGKDVPSTNPSGGSTTTTPGGGGATGGGSGGSDESATYTITVTVTNPTYGTASANKRSAAAGEKITVTLAAAEGRESYQLQSMTFKIGNEVVENFEHGYGTNADGSQNDDTRVFTMPAGNVTVTVTFVETGSTETDGFSYGSDAQATAKTSENDDGVTVDLDGAKAASAPYTITLEGNIASTWNSPDGSDGTAQYWVQLEIPAVEGWGVTGGTKNGDTPLVAGTNDDGFVDAGDIYICFNLADGAVQTLKLNYVEVEEEDENVSARDLEAEPVEVNFKLDATKVTIGSDATEAQLVKVPLENHQTEDGKDKATTAGEITEITMTLDKAAADLTIYNVTVVGTTSKHNSASTPAGGGEAYWVGLGLPVSAVESVTQFYTGFKHLTQKKTEDDDKDEPVVTTASKNFYLGYGESIIGNDKQGFICYEISNRTVIYNITFEMTAYSTGGTD